jgi:hypothetical protein
MVASVSSLAQVRFSEKEANIDTIDVITSKSSTLPYDKDEMRGMIQLVQAAKSTPLCCKEERIADFLAQMQRVVWHTTLLGLVGTRCTHSTPPLLTVSISSAPSVIFW